MATGTLDWSQCPAVESVPDRRGGAWVFCGTRMPVATVFENLELGTSVEEIIEQSMRILFDQGVPRGLAASLRSHDVTEARKLKWERISNGALLKLAE